MHRLELKGMRMGGWPDRVAGKAGLTIFEQKALSEGIASGLAGNGCVKAWLF